MYFVESDTRSTLRQPQRDRVTSDLAESCIPTYSAASLLSGIPYRNMPHQQQSPVAPSSEGLRRSHRRLWLLVSGIARRGLRWEKAELPLRVAMRDLVGAAGALDDFRR